MQSALTLAWGNVTDPSNHDPDNFRYLVHGDTGRSVRNDSETHGYEQQHFCSRLSRARTSIAELPFLSASLIDTQHRAMHARAAFGLIIEVIPEAVCVTSSQDLYSKDKSLKQLAAEHPILYTPDEVLAATSTTENNEIVLCTDELVTVTGLFMIRSALVAGHPSNIGPHDVARWAENANMPLVDLDS